MAIASLRNWVAAALTATVLPVQAAFIVIDDSDLNTITITAGDFEDGFFVDGALLTIGLGDSGSITFDDTAGSHSFEGSWIDLGDTVAGTVERFFGLGTTVYSGVESDASTDGFFGTISGAYAGFDPFTSYGTNPTTRSQDGSSADFSRPFLSATFISEVPEPSTLALFAAFATLGFPRRRRPA